MSEAVERLSVPLMPHPWQEWGDPPADPAVHSEFVECDDPECGCDSCCCDACWFAPHPVERAEPNAESRLDAHLEASKPKP